MRAKVSKAFFSLFGEMPNTIIRSPARVNIIGEHTDYNDGFVLPMALNEATWIAMTPRSDNRVCAYSVNFSQQANLDLSNLEKSKDPIWPEYIKGIANTWLSKKKQSLNGFNAAIYSDIPMGAGLSSSASFGLGIARAFCDANNITWDTVEMAKLTQASENNWVGVNCGIMDQLICAIAKKDHASLIDCRALTYKEVPLPDNTVIIIMDTSTRRGLVDSAYNERRKQCEQAAKVLNIPSLRDITLDALRERKDDLDPIVFKRAHHVASENQRVLQAVDAMQDQDPYILGELLSDSHKSLDKDFEVTNDALNIIVSCANTTPGCYGARMTGAGFGGCALALVSKGETMLFKQTVTRKFYELTGLHPAIYITCAGDGCDSRALEKTQEETQALLADTHT